MILSHVFGQNDNAYFEKSHKNPCRISADCQGLSQNDHFSAAGWARLRQPVPLRTAVNAKRQHLMPAAAEFWLPCPAGQLVSDPSPVLYIIWCMLQLWINAARTYTYIEVHRSRFSLLSWYFTIYSCIQPGSIAGFFKRARRDIGRIDKDNLIIGIQAHTAIIII